MNNTLFHSRLAKGSVRTAKWLALAIFCISFIIWSISPFVIRHYLTAFLTPYDISLDGRSHLRYNPLLSSLRIDDLQFKQSDITVLSLDHAELELHLHRFLWNSLYIRTLKLDGLYIDMQSHGNELVVAGIPIPQDSAVQNPEQEVTTEASPPLRIIAPLISLSDSRIHLNHNGIPHQLDLFDIKLKKINVENNKPSLNLEASLGLLQGKTEITAHIEPHSNALSLSSHISAQGMQLQPLHAYVKNEASYVQGELNLDIALDASIEGDTKSFNLHKTNIELIEFSTAASNTNLNLSKANVNLNDVGVILNPNNISATGQTEFSLSSLMVFDKHSTYLHLAALNLSPSNISLDGTSVNEVGFKTDKIVFSGITASQVKNANDIPPLAHVQRIEIRDIQLNTSVLDINEIEISALTSSPLINKKGEIETLAVLAASSPVKTEHKTESQAEEAQQKPRENATEGTEEKSETPIQFKLNKFFLSGRNAIHFKDESVSPSYERNITLDNVELNKLNSTSSELSPFLIKGRSNEYAHFDISGGVAAFTEKTNIEVSGSINEIALPAVSSYIKDALGFELKSGQLDTHIDVAVKESLLDGKVALHMRGIDMTAANDDAVGSMKDQGAIPLNVALGMLKDKQGNIKLDVPMGGSVDDPSFGVQSFLMLVAKKAALSQAKSYLMNTFVPYASVVSVAIAAGEFALKIRFEDLSYLPKATNIDPSHQTYVDEFINLLADKPKVQVKICGIATLADYDGEKSLRGNTTKETLDEQARLSLKAIAKARAENFKRYVTNTSRIDSSRLLLCSPEINFSENAQPRIKISL